VHPGLYSRRESLVIAARQAVKLLFGCVPLLVVAGTIEGFISPSTIPPFLKIAFGLLTAVLLYSYLLLAGRSTFWLERFVTPGRTEWFSFFYNILYAYPVLVGGVLYLLGRKAGYRRWVLSFSLAGYLGFLGYVCVPAIGPGYYYEGVYRHDLAGHPVNMNLDLLGQAASASGASVAGPGSGDGELALYQLAQRLNRPSSYSGLIPRNCFPSLHTAWGLIILAFTWRRLRPLFWIVLLPVCNLIAATVYLRFHYVIDLLAGTMLALLVMTCVPLVLAAEARVRRWVRGEAAP
jgi:hypothetical protein